jgi:hypothetical protein
VQLLVRLSVHMQRAVLIFDRGFRRIRLIRELGWLSQPVIIRLAAKVQGVSQPYTGLLSAHPLRPGQRVDLGLCALSQARPRPYPTKPDYFPACPSSGVTLRSPALSG